MANEEHARKLEQGVEAWNAWRSNNHSLIPDLTGAILLDANLRGANLSKADLYGAMLIGADLRDAELAYASLSHADLSDANLSGVFLFDTILHHTNLSGANLNGVGLFSAVLKETDLNRADLTGALLSQAVLVDLNLANVIGLDTCKYWAPSSIDHQTLQQSGPLPLSFLRGIGLPEMLIDYLPSLLHQAIQHHSCFISYSTKDQDFADRLYADLQNKGVRCWFAPDDMPIGGKLWDEIDSAIRLRDKLLLILSEHSIKSDWVEDEVTKAFEEERKRGQTVLFPIRLDDSVMDTDEAWAAKLRARHIGDFRHWKTHDAYKQSFERVLRDLTVKKRSDDKS